MAGSKAISKFARADVVALFGDFVPSDPALIQSTLATSPLAPVDPIARQRLCDVALGMAQTIQKHEGRTQQGHRLFDLQLNELKAKPRAVVGDLKVVLTLAEAEELFQEIAAKPFGHECVHEGCPYRSLLGAHALEQQGVFSEHALVRTMRGDLYIPTDKSSVGFTLAMNHMAPAVWVDGPLGPQRYVIDPAFHDGPVSVSDWKGSMLGCDGQELELLYFPRFLGHLTEVTLPRKTPPPSDWNAEELKQAAEWTSKAGEFHREMNGPDFGKALRNDLERMRELYGDTVPQAPSSSAS